MALPKTKIAQEPEPGQASALRDSPQRWWLLLLLFAAMLISYALNFGGHTRGPSFRPARLLSRLAQLSFA